MKKKMTISKKDYSKIEKEMFDKVKQHYDWAMNMSSECHFPWMPYFQQYFFANMPKPDFKSQKIKDVMYIKALRHYKIIPNENEQVRQYMHNALETKFGKED